MVSRQSSRTIYQSCCTGTTVSSSRAHRRLTHLVPTARCQSYLIVTLHDTDDPDSLKWKPPSENSIDFTLKLKFPALADDPDTCDYTKKPLFMLFMNHGQAGVHYYDMMNVDDDTWETYVLSFSSSARTDDSVDGRRAKSSTKIAWSRSCGTRTRRRGSS
jgi:hypothetical protein